MYTPKAKRKPRKPIDQPQTKFLKGYYSTVADSRMPLDALADMTNMEIRQDGTPGPRPSTAAYGPEFPGTCIGIGTFIKLVDGAPEKWQITMQNVSGIGKVYINKDADDWELIVDADNDYDELAWAMFTQSNNRVYISNGEDDMSYYDIDAGTIVKYTALTTPSTPTATGTGLSGSNFTYYYRITANNNVGESAASVADTEAVSTIRDQWIPASQYVTVTWSSVAGAESYNVYVGDSAGSEKYLATVTGLTYKDDGSQFPNPFKIAPPGNSTAGPTLTYLYNKSGQLFGVGDVDNPSYLWYSGTGTESGDFSPFNGGGYVAIDYGGDSLPVAVRNFRDGKGTPAITVLSKGTAGKGRLHHVTFTVTTLGDTPIPQPEVYEANGQSGTVSARAVIEAQNSLWYPTGTSFKSTGTKANVVNILATDSVSQAIEPDVRNLSLAAMDGCCGLEYEDKLYWAVPYGADSNTEIWVKDLSRSGLWILRWTVAADHLWLYEDNSGSTHFCALVDNTAVEFTRSIDTQDQGIPFRTRLASGAMVYDPAGVTMASIEKLRFKLLYPKGDIQVNAYGQGKNGSVSSVGTTTFTPTVSFTGWGQLLYSNSDGSSVFSGDVGAADFAAQAIAVVPVKINKILNELKWEIVTEGANCDYTLSASHTKGKLIPDLYYA